MPRHHWWLCGLAGTAILAAGPANAQSSAGTTAQQIDQLQDQVRLPRHASRLMERKASTA
jgi:hypothetical protein